MEYIKELLKSKGVKAIGDDAYKWLVEHDYLHNEVIGWEKREVFEKFNLNPNMNGVPCHYVDEAEFKEKRTPITNEYGKRTGEYKITKQTSLTGYKTLAVNNNFMDYLRWKEERYTKWIKQKMAKELTPLPEENGDNN